MKTASLTTAASLTNPERIEVAYRTAGNTFIAGESGFVGGKLGGLIEFRKQTLEPAQNSLGRVAIGLAGTFNVQHRLGFDLNGDPGKDFFAVASPVVNAHTANTGTAVISGSIADANALTTSDYSLKYDGTEYTLTRLSDNTATQFPTLPQTVDGVTLDLTSGAPATGDSFLIRPTINGATAFAVAISDPAEIAAAAVTGAVGDNRNALLLAALQKANTLGNGTATYQGAYSQLVSQIGNKTRELDVSSSAAGKLLSEATLSIQAESGVNLDEEATNLLRYQQAYQAAGKVMQIASEMFDVLLTLGR